MKYCNSCNVQVSGNRKNCPLCQGILSPGEYQDEAFPKIPFVYRENSILIKIMILISVIIACVSVAVNIMLPKGGAWSMFVLGGLVSLWISIITAINKRNNILKNILYQVVVISVIVIIWDFFTGWKGWSITYVIPFVCFFSMIAMAVISRFYEFYAEDCILYIIIGGMFGLVQIVFVFTGKLTVLYPSLICIVASIVSLSKMLIFNKKIFLEEIKRRLHM